jgi:hypothetical protein
MKGKQQKELESSSVEKHSDEKSDSLYFDGGSEEDQALVPQSGTNLEY